MSHSSVLRQDQRVSWWYVWAALLCFSGLAAAQEVAGTPSWSAFDADSTGTTVLNLQNLNINLNIPVMRKNGAFPFRFALYGNSNYYEKSSSTWATGLANGPQGAANGIMGWNDLDVGVYYGSAAPAYCPGTNNPTTIYGNYYLQLADGTSHPLPLADHLDSAGCLYTSFTGTTIDGSGYTVSAGSTVSIYDKNGDSIAISQTGAPSLTDSNNNAISLNVTTGVFTDTLGLTPLTMTAGGITTGTFTWTGPTSSEDVVMTATAYTALRSAFGCSGITDINVANSSLSTGISFPDGTSMTLAYEATPGYPNDRTGRLTTLKLRSGGTVVFGYPGTSANNYGMNCTYQIPNRMTRTTADGQWTYTLNFFAIGSEEGETDTVLDPGNNKKVYTFTGIGSGAAAQGYSPTLTETKYYLNTGTVSSPSYSSTPTKQVVYCYGDGPSPTSTTISGCPNALISLPVTQVTTFTTIGGMTTSAETYTTYDAYGNTTLSERFDFASTSGGTPLIATTTVYGSWSGSACVAVNSSGPSGVSTINSEPCTIVTTQSGSTVTSSRFTYSSTGNLIYAYVSPNGGSTFLSNTTANSYNSNGSPSVLYDVANNSTTYSYNGTYYTACSGCTNYPFATESTSLDYSRNL